MANNRRKNHEWPAMPFRKDYADLCHRARRQLEVSRRKLPAMTEKQIATIVDMMVGAYMAGEVDAVMGQFHQMRRDMTKLAGKAVAARRKKSKREIGRAHV